MLKSLPKNCKQRQQILSLHLPSNEPNDATYPAGDEEVMQKGAFTADNPTTSSKMFYPQCCFMFVYINSKKSCFFLQPTPSNGLLKLITRTHTNYTVMSYTVHAGTEGTLVSPFDLKGVLCHQRTWPVVWMDWCLTVSVSHQQGSREDHIITSGSPPGIYLEIKNQQNMKPWLLTDIYKTKVVWIKRREFKKKNQKTFWITSLMTIACVLDLQDGIVETSAVTTLSSPRLDRPPLTTPHEKARYWRRKHTN